MSCPSDSRQVSRRCCYQPVRRARRRVVTLGLVGVLALALILAPGTADADVTVFTGVNFTPSNRAARGFAAGLSLLVLGFEFEYSSTIEDELLGAPSLRTGMFNVLVQTPVPLAGLQFYGTIGGGIYRERLVGLQETNVGMNFGGGVKIALAGPFRARIDYRVFNLRGQPLIAKPRRIYFGLNVAF